MRTPYVVGRWVRGRSHYGRERLIDYLLNGPDSAIWLVGTRRMGKTSMLRHLESIAEQTRGDVVPLVWDLQGCQTPDELAAELRDCLLDAAARFSAYGIDVDAYEGVDALAILRGLVRLLGEQGKTLLLLIDEGEALLNTARVDSAWLGRLRRMLQDPRIRAVVTSTKQLARLNQNAEDWSTSPFLFGFSMVNLPRLEESAARALVRQAQGDQVVVIADSEVDDVVIHTNGQPYLIQLLCQRLFEDDGNGQGVLRPITDDDLAVDQLLGGLFQIDYQHLTQTERRVLLAVADLTIAKESELLVRLSDLAPHRIRMFLYGLERAGLVRHIFGQWAVGNEFLRRWIADHADELERQLQSPDDDGVHESVLEVSRHHEIELLRREIARVEAELAKLEQGIGDVSTDDQLAVMEAADRLRRTIARLRKELAAIDAV